MSFYMRTKYRVKRTITPQQWIRSKLRPSKSPKTLNPHIKRNNVRLLETIPSMDVSPFRSKSITFVEPSKKSKKDLKRVTEEHHDFDIPELLKEITLKLEEGEDVLSVSYERSSPDLIIQTKDS
jgi:hypothetical protein